MDRNDLVLGGIALVAGVLLGLLFAPRGASLEDIESAIDERLAAVEGATSGTGDSITSLQTQIGESMATLRSQMEESIAALQSEVGAIEERIGAMEVAISDSASEQAARAENLSAAISSRFDSIGSVLSEQSDAMRTRFDGLRSSLAGVDPAAEVPEASGIGGAPQPASEAPGAPDATLVPEADGEVLE